MSGVVSIRGYQPRDRAGLDNVCIRTADAGADASDSYEDPSILPAIFAAPYAYLEPDLAFVAVDGEDVVGYVLGTADTARFAKRFRDEWLPLVAERYPPLAGEPRTPDEGMRALLHHPERMCQPALAAYPAHLHIDLLPPYQRRGYGRRLMAAFLAALHRKGVPAVHLGMLTVNRPARAFYDRLGFHVVDVPDPGQLTYLGLRVPGAGSTP